MEILSEMPTGMGGKWVLVKYKEDFYAYGYERDLHSLWGFPVNQCGTKEEVLSHCKAIAELCRKNIAKYQTEIAKKQSDGWKLLLKQEEKEMDMLTKFASILTEAI